MKKNKHRVHIESNTPLERKCFCRIPVVDVYFMCQNYIYRTRYRIKWVRDRRKKIIRVRPLLYFVEAQRKRIKSKWMINRFKYVLLS